MISHHADDHGRFLIVKCQLFGELCKIINIYKPPYSDMSFWSKIQTVLDSSPTGMIIFGGDLNSIFSPQDSSTKIRTINQPNRLLRISHTLKTAKAESTSYLSPD